MARNNNTRQGIKQEIRVCERDVTDHVREIRMHERGISRHIAAIRSCERQIVGFSNKMSRI